MKFAGERWVRDHLSPVYHSFSSTYSKSERWIDVFEKTSGGEYRGWSVDSCPCFFFQPEGARQGIRQGLEGTHFFDTPTENTGPFFSPWKIRSRKGFLRFSDLRRENQIYKIEPNISIFKTYIRPKFLLFIHYGKALFFDFFRCNFVVFRNKNGRKFYLII